MMGMVLGRAVFAETTAEFMLWLGVTAFLFMPFLHTLSRGGYVGFVVMYVALVCLAPRRKLALLAPLVLLLFLGPTMFPERVIERVQATFLGATPYGSVGERIGLEPSAAQRIDVWFTTFQDLKKHPLIGYGVAGFGMVDQQYCLVLGELGLIGAGLFLWTRWRLWSVAWRAFHAVTDPRYRSIVLGYLCAYLGLLVQSLTGNIFIIVRIMEPFWFITAMVVVLPMLPPRPEAALRHA